MLTYITIDDPLIMPDKPFSYLTLVKFLKSPYIKPLMVIIINKAIFNIVRALLNIAAARIPTKEIKKVTSMTAIADTSKY